MYSSVVTISSATSGVVTWADHGLTQPTPVVFTTTGTLPTRIFPFNTLPAPSGGVYYVLSPSPSAFFVSTIPNSLAVNTTPSSGSGIHTCMVHTGGWSDLKTSPVTVSIGPSANIYWPSHNLRDTDAVSFLTIAPSGAAPSGIIPGFIYYVDSVIDSNNIQISNTYGGNSLTTYTSGNDFVGVIENNTDLGDSSVMLSNVPLAVPITINNIIPGSRVRVAKTDTNEELYSGEALISILTFLTKASGQVTIDIRKSSSYPKYIPYKTFGIIGTTGLDVFVSQVEDTFA